MVKLSGGRKKEYQKRAQSVLRTIELKEPSPWMVKLAEKYEIEADTVLAFFNSITYNHARKQTKRKRTEEFFELYFEGVKEGNYDTANH